MTPRQAEYEINTIIFIQLQPCILLWPVTNAFAEPVCSNLIGGCTEKKQFVKEPYDCDNCITVINFIANLAGLDGYEVGIVQTVDLLKVY